MTHELEKLDQHLGVPTGTSYKVIIQHTAPAELNPKLEPYGIILDRHGMVAQEYRTAWKALMIEAGISQRYWKDGDLPLPEEVVIQPLEGL